MKKILLQTPLVLLCALIANGSAEEIAITQKKIDKWIETRQIISEERANWLGEKAMLETSQGILSDELTALNRAVELLSETSTMADVERENLQAEREELERSNEMLAVKVRTLEIAVQELSARFPTPLLVKIKPLLQNIPEDVSRTKKALGQRLLTVLGVLSQAEKFNGTLTLQTNARDVSGTGVQERVTTLYWGLAFAVYVDDAGKFAGMGLPGPKGWEWSTHNESASDVRRFIATYSGETDQLDFVNIPVEIR
tara:strand:- start:8529 stop:9293 length:765 start_codon:yes stop_codon:yes gene_type:complete